MNVLSFLRRRRPQTRWQRWKSGFANFFFRDGPPHFLALFRILFGLVLFIEWSLHAPDVAMEFSNQGLVLPLDRGLSGAFPSLFVPPSVTIAWLIYGLFMASIALIILGLWTRGALLYAVFAYLYYWHLHLHLLGGSFDRIFFFLLMVLLISGCDRTFSLRMYFKKGSWTAWEPISALPQRLIALQITALYLGVGWQKLWLPDWQSGEIIRLSLMGRWATPLALAVGRLESPAWLMDLSNEAVKFCQFILPWLFWFAKTRWLAIGLQAFFLIIVATFLGMWWFLALIPASFAFWEPEKIQKWVSLRKT